MAIVKTNQVRSASCKFITHIDGEGNEKYSTKAIANFKTGADLEDVNEVVLAIASLYSYGVKAITLTERSELDEI